MTSTIQNIPYNFTEKKDTRSGFGAGLLEAGNKNSNVVALCADLLGSMKMNEFMKAFPERFFQIGIAEANPVAIVSTSYPLLRVWPTIGLTTLIQYATGVNRLRAWEEILKMVRSRLEPCQYQSGL